MVSLSLNTLSSGLNSCLHITASIHNIRPYLAGGQSTRENIHYSGSHDVVLGKKSLSGAWLVKYARAWFRRLPCMQVAFCLKCLRAEMRWYHRNTCSDLVAQFVYADHCNLTSIADWETAYISVISVLLLPDVRCCETSAGRVWR